MRSKKIKSAIAAFLVCMGIMTGCSESDGGNQTQNVDPATATGNAVCVQTAERDVTASDVVFSHASGFYDGNIALEMSCGISGAKIYYTTDGSVPDETANLYEGAIVLTDKTSEPNVLSAQTGTSATGDYIPPDNVLKANIIRAAALLPDGTMGSVFNGTFWIGIDRAEKYGDVPVISLITDMDNLYDYETGIYVLGKEYDDWKASSTESVEAWQSVANYTGRGKEWERPAAIEYIPADGTAGFFQDIGIRIMGAASRNAPQKSFRLTAREAYGKKSVEYELIPDNERSDGMGNVTKYKSFVLRNGGNDSDTAKIRDPYLQRLAEGARFDTMQSTPCIVYLNGEYWGAYTIAEDYSDNYIENNYGIDNHNVVIVKRGEIEEGEDDDIILYNDMYDFIVNNDMTNPDNYEKACEMLDIGSYIDSCAMNFYIYNEDCLFHGNNWQMWRVRTPDDTSEYADGKWRMLVYDTDYSTGIYSDGKNYNEDNISPVINPEVTEDTGADESDKSVRESVEMFRALYQNEDFKRELVISMCDFRNIYYQTDRAGVVLREMMTVYKQIIPDTFERFGPDWLLRDNDINEYYTRELSQLSEFMNGRNLMFPTIMQSAMDLGELANVSVSSSDSTKGTVKINNTMLDLSSNYKGRYFTDYPVTVTAVPADGATFKGWEIEDCEISDSSSETSEIVFTGSCSIKAVFE